LAVFLEELGIPMPIPTDLLIIFAGATHARTLPQFVGWVVVLSLASLVGASGLYAVVRRGGRPLVERYGRYVHLGPKQLARSEAWLARYGWYGIAIGRAVPGLRYVTVIACGLLNVPYRRFASAHLFGSAVYIMVFLGLGRIFGPAIIEHIHVPSAALRLVWLLALALGLPLLLAWWAKRAHIRQPAQPSRARVLSAVLLASFVGASALAASLSTAVTVAVLSDGHWFAGPIQLLDRRSHAISATVVFGGIVLACAGVAVTYYEWILPRLAPRIGTRLWQVLDLMVLSSAVVAVIGGSMRLFGARVALPWAWWHISVAVGIVLVLSVLSFAITTVYGRVLAIVVLPSLRRAGMWPARNTLPTVKSLHADTDDTRR
jgi:membrane protein DedA with SNARE-associated domain